MPDLVGTASGVLDGAAATGDAWKARKGGGTVTAFTTPGWKWCVFNGGIYGIPIPRSVLGALMFRRNDIIRAKGLDPDPGSFTEFRTFFPPILTLWLDKTGIG